MENQLQYFGQLIAFVFSHTSHEESERREEAQKELRAVQTGPDGWNLALQLLANSTDPNVQFVAAQTLLVQLNVREYLPVWQQTCANLFEAIRFCANGGAPLFVLRKVLAASARLFWLCDALNELPVEVFELLQNSAQQKSIFDFTVILLEEAEGVPAAKIRNKLVPTTTDLVRSLLLQSPLGDPIVLKCIETYTTYFFDVFADFPLLLTNKFAELNTENDNEALLDCLTSLFTNSSSQWKPSVLDRLYEVLGQTSGTISAMANDSDSEFSELRVSYTRLVIAVCENDFTKHSELHAYLASVAATSVPVVEDPLAFEVLEFWNQFAEEIISSGLNSCKEIIVAVISGYWPRIRLYPELQKSDWDEMSSFRKDFADFLELAYPLLGIHLFEHLSNVVLTSIGSGDWMAIESALYCLNGLSEIIGTDFQGNTPEFSCVQQIFQSSLWEELGKCDNIRVKQTAVNTIGCFVDFFSSPQGAPYLALTLNYLFSSLYTPSLQNIASKSILKLCDMCRTRLTNEIHAFLSVYEQCRHQLESIPHIRTVAAVACVCQAVSDPAEKLKYSAELFQLVVNMPHSPGEEMEVFLQTKLKCIATLGKHLNAPGSESTTGGEVISVDMQLQNYFRPLLEQLISIEGSSDNLIVIEAVCEVIKVCLFDEVYSLPETFIVSFICAKASSGDAELVLPVIDIARIFVATRVANKKHGVQPQLSFEAAQQLVDLVVNYGSKAVVSSIELLTELVPLFEQQDLLTRALELPLAGIVSSERFVLRSAVSFWREYLGAVALNEYTGPLLIRALLKQVSGNAARSEVPLIADVFKAMMLKQPVVAAHLLNVFVVEQPAGRNLAKQDEKTRKDFVAQLVLVKGGRKTGDIVQQFWQKCRGLPASYDPKV